MTNKVSVEAIVSGKTLEPGVHLNVENKIFHMTPEQAIAFANSVIEAAKMAVTDAFTIQYLLQELKLPVQETALIVNGLRKYRKDRKEKLNASTAKPHSSSGRDDSDPTPEKKDPGTLQ